MLQREAMEYDRRQIRRLMAETLKARGRDPEVEMIGVDEEWDDEEASVAADSALADAATAGGCSTPVSPPALALGGCRMSSPSFSVSAGFSSSTSIADSAVDDAPAAASAAASTALLSPPPVTPGAEVGGGGGGFGGSIVARVKLVARAEGKLRYEATTRSK